MTREEVKPTSVVVEVKFASARMVLAHAWLCFRAGIGLLISGGSATITIPGTVSRGDS